MHRYNVAVIGAGIMGRRMLAKFDRHSRFDPAGVWDPSQAALDIVAGAFPNIPIAPDPGSLIANQNTDLVYIASPPRWHEVHAKAAIDAGKAVFCEKPLGVNIAESAALVSRLEDANTPNVVNFDQASCTAYERTQADIESGIAGDLLGIDIVVRYHRWPRAWQIDADWLRFRDQGGLTREVISHFVFLAERLVGPAALVWSKPSYPPDPDLCETRIQAKLDSSGVPVSIFGSVGGVGPDRQEVTVLGSKRSFRISDFSFLEISDGGAWQDALAEDTEARARAWYRHFDNVAKWLDGDAHPLASAREALSVQKIVEAMLKI